VHVKLIPTIFRNDNELCSAKKIITVAVDVPRRNCAYLPLSKKSVLQDLHIDNVGVTIKKYDVT
jgi:hypothetical protein